ncbi:hypothetical protein [Rhizobacter fulvus]
MDQGQLYQLLDTARQRWDRLAAGAREFHKRALAGQDVDLAEMDRWHADTQTALKQYVCVLEKLHTQRALMHARSMKLVDGRPSASE